MPFPSPFGRSERTVESGSSSRKRGAKLGIEPLERRDVLDGTSTLPGMLPGVETLLASTAPDISPSQTGPVRDALIRILRGHDPSANSNIIADGIGLPPSLPDLPLSAFTTLQSLSADPDFQDLVRTDLATQPNQPILRSQDAALHATIDPLQQQKTTLLNQSVMPTLNWPASANLPQGALAFLPIANNINDLAMSPKGDSFAIACTDGSVGIWSMAGTLLRKIQVSSNMPLSSLTYNSTGSQLAVGSYDMTCTLWDPTTGVKQKTYTFTNYVTNLRFVDDAHLAVADFSSPAQVLDLTSTKTVTLSTTQSTIGLAVSSDKKIIYTGEHLSKYGNGLVRASDAVTGATIRTFDMLSNTVVSTLAISPDGKILAASDVHSILTFFDATNGQMIQQIPSTYADSLAFTADGSTLVETDNYGQLRTYQRVGSTFQLTSTSTIPGIGMDSELLPSGLVLTAAVGSTSAQSGIYTYRLTGAVTAAERDAKVAALDSQINALQPTAAALEQQEEAAIWNTVLMEFGKNTGPTQQQQIDALTAQQQPLIAQRDALLAQIAKIVPMNWPTKSSLPAGALGFINGQSTRTDQMAFSADGKLLATSGVDGSIGIWNTATGTLLRMVKVSTQLNLAVAFNPSGTELAVGTFDRTVVILNPTTGAILQTYSGFGNVVTGVSYTDDTHVAVAAIVPGDKIIDRKTGNMVTLSNGTNAGIVVASPDGKTVYNSEGSSVRSSDAVTGATLQSYPGLSSGVYGLTASKDGTLLAGGSGAGQVILWDPKTAQTLQVISTGSPTAGLSFSADSQQLIVGTYSGKVLYYQRNGAQFTLTAQSQVPGLVYDMKVGNGSVLVASNGSSSLANDGMYLFPVPGVPTAAQLQTQVTNLNAQIAALDAQKAAVQQVPVAAGISVADQLSQQISALQTQRQMLVTQLSALQQNATVAAVDPTAQAPWWPDAQNLPPSVVGFLNGQSGRTDATAISPKGDLFATTGLDGTVGIWNLLSGTLIRKVSVSATMTSCVAFNASGTELAVGSYDKTVTILNPQTGTVLKQYTGYPNVIARLSYVDDTHLALTAINFGTDQILNRTTGGIVAFGDGGNSVMLTTSADGKIVYNGEGNGGVRASDTATGALLRMYIGLSGGVYGLTASPDGTLLIGCSADGSLIVWDAKTAQILQSISGGSATNQFVSVSMTADSQQLVAVNTGGWVRTYQRSGNTFTQSAATWVPGMPYDVQISKAGVMLVTVNGGPDPNTNGVYLYSLSSTLTLQMMQNRVTALSATIARMDAELATLSNLQITMKTAAAATSTNDVQTQALNEEAITAQTRARLGQVGGLLDSFAATLAADLATNPTHDVDADIDATRLATAGLQQEQVVDTSILSLAQGILNDVDAHLHQLWLSSMTKLPVDSTLFPTADTLTAMSQNSNGTSAKALEARALLTRLTPTTLSTLSRHFVLSPEISEILARFTVAPQSVSLGELFTLDQALWQQGPFLQSMVSQAAHDEQNAAANLAQVQATMNAKTVLVQADRDALHLAHAQHADASALLAAVTAAVTELPGVAAKVDTAYSQMAAAYCSANGLGIADLPGLLNAHASTMLATTPGIMDTQLQAVLGMFPPAVRQTLLLVPTSADAVSLASQQYVTLGGLYNAAANDWDAANADYQAAYAEYMNPAWRDKFFNYNGHPSTATPADRARATQLEGIMALAQQNMSIATDRTNQLTPVMTIARDQVTAAFGNAETIRQTTAADPRLSVLGAEWRYTMTPTVQGVLPGLGQVNATMRWANWNLVINPTIGDFVPLPALSENPTPMEIEQLLYSVNSLAASAMPTSADQLQRLGDALARSLQTMQSLQDNIILDIRNLNNTLSQADRNIHNAFIKIYNPRYGQFAALKPSFAVILTNLRNALQTPQFASLAAGYADLLARAQVQATRDPFAEEFNTRPVVTTVVGPPTMKDPNDPNSLIYRFVSISEVERFVGAWQDLILSFDDQNAVQKYPYSFQRALRDKLQKDPKDYTQFPDYAISVLQDIFQSGIWRNYPNVHFSDDANFIAPQAPPSVPDPNAAGVMVYRLVTIAELDQVVTRYATYPLTNADQATLANFPYSVRKALRDALQRDPKDFHANNDEAINVMGDILRAGTWAAYTNTPLADDAGAAAGNAGVGGDPNAVAHLNSPLNSTRESIRGDLISGKRMASQLTSEILGLYVDSDPKTYPKYYDGLIVRDDTMAGRIFNGLYQAGTGPTKKSDDAMRTLLVKAEFALGVDADDLYNNWKPGSATFFEASLQRTFANAGYANIFVASNVPALAGRSVVSTTMNTSKTYVDADQVIHVHFDLAMLPTDTAGTKLYDHIKVLLMDINGNPLAYLPVTYAQATTGMYLDVKLSDIGKAGFYGANGFKLRLDVMTGSADTGTHLDGVTSPLFLVSLKGVIVDHLSTNPDPIMSTKEDDVLNILEQPGAFPVASPSSWSWTIESGAHESTAMYAVDLNYGSGFDDRGLPVSSPDSGYVSKVDPSFGTVEVTHTTPAGTTWTSRVLHMPVKPFLDASGNVVAGEYTVQQITQHWIDPSDHNKGSALTYGTTRIVYQLDPTTKHYFSWIEEQGTDGSWTKQGLSRTTLSPKDLMGFVGGQGGDGTDAFSPHFHYEVLNASGQSIDLRKLLIDKFGIKNITASDAGPDGKMLTKQDVEDDVEFRVHWDDNIGAFVTSDIVQKDGTIVNPHLVLDRSAMKNKDGVQYWLAYEGTDVGKMTRVVWVSYQYRDPSNNLMSDQGWISINPVGGRRELWSNGAWSDLAIATIYDPNSKKYVPLQ